MVSLVKAMVFPVVTYGCESWTIRKAERWKEIQPVHSKGDQSWLFTGGTDVEAETPILWPPEAKRWFIWKDPDAGKDWVEEESRTTDDEVVGWYYRLNGHEFGYIPGVSDRQGGLVCCGSWGCKESDTTKQLNWTELNISFRSSADLGIFFLEEWINTSNGWLLFLRWNMRHVCQIKVNRWLLWISEDRCLKLRTWQ